MTSAIIIAVIVALAYFASRSVFKSVKNGGCPGCSGCGGGEGCSGCCGDRKK